MEETKGNFLAQIVSGRVLEAFQQAVVRRAVEVQALMPGDLADLGQMRQPELGVLLIAPAFLALPLVVDDIMRQPAVAQRCR